MNYLDKKILLTLVGLLGLLLNSSSLLAQQNTKLFGPDVHQLNWNDFVRKVEASTDHYFYYDSEALQNLRIDAPGDSLLLLDLLRQNLQPLQIEAAIDRQGNVFLHPKTAIITEVGPAFFEGQIYDSTTQVLAKAETQKQFLQTTNELVVETLVVGNAQTGAKERKSIFSGTIKSEDDDSPVGGATLYFDELGTGTATNIDGFFTITLAKGKYTLTINSLSFKEKKYKVEVLSSDRVNLTLIPQLINLKGVVVTANQDNKIQSSQMGFERLTIKSIKEIPLVLGERDVLKVATLLPGIQSIGEGASGFNVRGSPADQNLFYINKVPIYNTSHMFGFFSAFNSDAISDFSLFKSNIPMKYGGRLASIFEVTTKNGNQNKYTARGGISPITARVLAEGPIVKEKSSFLIGLRSTYSDWVLNLINNEQFQGAKARFADGVANVQFELSENDRLKFFGYHSFDDIKFGTNQFDYQNTGGSLGWTHFFKNKHNFDFHLVYSKYGLNIGDETLQVEAFQLENVLEHKEARLDFTMRPNNDHEITFGANAVLYEIDQGEFLPLNELSQVQSLDLGEEQGLEMGIYVGENWNLSDNFSLSGGLRYNLYTYLGPQKVLTYTEGVPRTPDTVRDTLDFSQNQQVSNSGNLDYRLGAKFVVNPNFSLKASYNKTHQYIFLLSNTIAIAPTDKWKLSDYHIDPMEGQQYSLGAYTNILNGNLELTIESYYKQVKNLVEYKDGANLVVNEAPEQDVLQGDLNAYGIELMLRKSRGRFNGWLNYTYSRSQVLVAGGPGGDNINFGERYPANYDKPHSVNLVSNYKFSRRFSLSGNLVYSTGRPITYPSTLYIQNDVQLINYSLRNEYRIPDYFRFDLSAKIEGNLRSDKLLHSSWVISLYNVVGRNNAYSVYFESTSRGVVGKKVSIFASPIFSITYNFKLGSYAD